MDKFTVCLRVYVEVPVEAETPEEAVEIAYGLGVGGDLTVRNKSAVWYLYLEDTSEALVFDENGNEITLKED